MQKPGKRKLEKNYRLALKALKDQAEAVEDMLEGNRRLRKGKIKLEEAQTNMSKVDDECRHIVKLVDELKDITLEIPDLTEAQLLKILLSHKKNNLARFHLLVSDSQPFSHSPAGSSERREPAPTGTTINNDTRTLRQAPSRPVYPAPLPLHR